MSQIIKSQFIKRALLKNPINENLIKAQHGERSLAELISRFPKKGKGMKVWKKTWPENSYYHIMHVHQNTPKTYRYYGVKYWDGQI